MERRKTDRERGKETETEGLSPKRREPLAATANPSSPTLPDPSRPQGLSASLAAELLLRDGPNALRPPRGTPEYVKFARQLAGGLQCLMWVAAAICLIAFAIQASEGDLTTDDNVSGGCWGQIWSVGARRQGAWDLGHKWHGMGM